MNKNLITLSKYLLLASVSLHFINAEAQTFDNVKPVKNVIVMIPDGTSISSVSLARWKQWYEDENKPNLNIDPYMCGSVRTHSSNAPIGDSAPTTSCYMTGYNSQSGFVSTYPQKDEANDITLIDPSRAYQPLTTLLEAAKIKQGKATGLVVTCEFPHATPADCAAHSYSRGKYEWIIPQMVHNNIDVVIGGGTSLLSATNQTYLKENGYGVYLDDLAGMRKHTGNKMWSLFFPVDMPYDLDRVAATTPSLAEMTDVAIQKLSTDKDGFFLMVEGSKVDWAAHDNDPVGIATDFLAFDKACGVALEYAKKEGNTLVIIMPDHGNSGISIGANRCKGYDKLTKDQLFGKFSQFKLTVEGFEKKINETPYANLQELFSTYAGFELSDTELHALNNCKTYKHSPIPTNERTSKGVDPILYSSSLKGFMSKLITSKTCIGFTTNGHTGEEVFLAAYHPQQTRPYGVLSNVQINHYIHAAMGLEQSLDEITSEIFAKHSDVFNDYKYEIIPAKNKDEQPTLVVKNKRKKLTIQPFTNQIIRGKDEVIELNSVIVYVDKNNTFYLPTHLADLLN
jgi:alkaline phosphatase